MRLGVAHCMHDAEAIHLFSIYGVHQTPGPSANARVLPMATWYSVSRRETTRIDCFSNRDNASNTPMLSLSVVGGRTGDWALSQTKEVCSQYGVPYRVRAILPKRRRENGTKRNNGRFRRLGANKSSRSTSGETAFWLY